MSISVYRLALAAHYRCMSPYDSASHEVVQHASYSDPPLQTCTWGSIQVQPQYAVSYNIYTFHGALLNDIFSIYVCGQSSLCTCFRQQKACYGAWPEERYADLTGLAPCL